MTEGEALVLPGKLPGQRPGPLPRCFGKADGDGFGHAVAAGDFDGDGDTDLAVAAPYDNDYRHGSIGAVYVYRRSGTSLVAWTRVSASTLGLGPNQSTRFADVLVAADFDQDGRAELAIHQTGPDANGIFPGRVIVTGADADDVFAVEQIVTQTGLGTDEPGDGFGAQLAVGDFDADGAPDLVASASNDNEGGGPYDGRVYVFRGGGAQLAPWKVLSPQAWNMQDETFGRTIVVGDFDANGYDDLAVGLPRYGCCESVLPQGIVLTYRSISGNALIPSRWIEGRNYVSGSRYRRAEFGLALAAADMDGDGDDELVIAAPGASSGSNQETGAVTIFRNAVTAPQLWHTIAMPFPNANQGTWLAAGDFNSNGAVDLAVGQDVYGSIGNLLVWKGRVGNTPVLGDTYDERLDAIAAADIDGDGKSDLIASPDGTNAALLYGLGRSPYMPVLDRTLYQQAPGCASYWGAPPSITLQGARQRELDVRLTSSGTVDQAWWMRQYGPTSWYEESAVADRTDTGLEPDEEYCYIGRTLQVGSDAYSDTTTACFETTPPIAGPSITLTGNTTSALSVRMVAGGGADRIRSRLQGQSGTTQTQTGTTVNRTFSGLSAGTQYCVVADSFHPATNEWSQPRTQCFSTEAATQTGSDSVTLSKQTTPPQGAIPYAGWWYADPGQRPVRIRVPASIGDYWIHFVKDGHSTAECFGPNHDDATVTVQDGGELDAADIAAIQGGTPPPGQDLPWLACITNSSGTPNWVAFYVDWENP
ncbi:MAG: VCBS repeat-containing protein [Kofleriaceae bacterium]|nr:MAG: VCBS repeat-containing protein [Kofleriaceae bacterium]